MKTLGPHALTVVKDGEEFPLELWFEIEEPILLDQSANIYKYEGRFRYSCVLFSSTAKGASTGEVAMLAGLMRLAAEYLRLFQRTFEVDLYCSIPGDLSTDWSFYTFGRDDHEFVDPNTLFPPAE